MIPRKKTLEEIILNFRNEVMREYNIRDGVIRLTLSPELFNQHMIELSEKTNLTPSFISMHSIAGVSIGAGVRGGS